VSLASQKLREWKFKISIFSSKIFKIIIRFLLYRLLQKCSKISVHLNRSYLQFTTTFNFFYSCVLVNLNFWKQKTTVITSRSLKLHAKKMFRTQKYVKDFGTTWNLSMEKSYVSLIQFSYHVKNTTINSRTFLGGIFCFFKSVFIPLFRHFNYRMGKFFLS